MVGRKEIRLSGSGGQGLILGGIILGEAGILDGNNAVQSQSYGPEARGGASKSEVIISDEEVDFPKVQKADLLLSLTDVAYKKYIGTLKDGGTLIVDSSVNIDKEDKKHEIIQIPILYTASEKVGKAMVANIVAIGAIQELTGVVSKESLEKAVLNRVPPGTEDVNRAALSAGYDLIKK